jgi:hypothetical protein
MSAEHPINRRWNQRQRDWGVVIWMSFLTACAGSVVLFGLNDPLDIAGAWAEQFNIGVRLAYGLGFAFLFLLCLCASALTVFMIRTGPDSGHAAGKGRRSKPVIRDPSADLDDENWK